MNNFTVKMEYEPKRCEICHQRDYFDPLKNYCFRCFQLQEPEELTLQIEDSNVDLFDRPLIISYIEVSAEILRQTNKEPMYYNYISNISPPWILENIGIILFLAIMTLSYISSDFASLIVILIVKVIISCF